jgi:hypothetical protein
MGLKPEQLRQMLGSAASPTAALALKATSDMHFDILFNDSAATSHRSETAA